MSFASINAECAINSAGQINTGCFNVIEIADRNPDQAGFAFDMIFRVFKTGRRLLAVTASFLLLSFAFWMSGAANILEGMSKFSLFSLMAMLSLLTVNLFLVSFRLWRILDHYAIPLPWHIASRASIAGHVAGLFIMSLFGQVLGRQAVLRHYGAKPVVIASLAAYERVVLTLISALMCLLGAGILMGTSTIGVFLGQMSLAEISLASVGAIALSLWFGYSRFEAQMAARMRSWSVLGYVLEIASITLLSQLLMLGVFVIGVWTIQPDIALLQAVAAAAVISFAASVPITVNGWGIREVAAVYVLGQLGISGADAVAISVTVGLCSTAVIVFSAVYSSKRLAGEKPHPNCSPSVYQTDQEIEKAGAWILATATAVLVFFQVHAELPGMWGVLNFNFADPFAILALAGVVLHAVTSRHAPRWKIDQFNKVLLAISLLMLAAFLRGVLDIGVTQWALGGRLLGWVVLLGYVSAGYLMVAHAGAQGLRRLCETTVAAGVVVVVLNLLLRLSSIAGCDYFTHITPNFEGYASNRNAFAFQMLVCIVLILSYSAVKARGRSTATCSAIDSPWPSRDWFGHTSAGGIGHCRPRSFALPLGIILLGLVLSSSRAGWLTAGIMLLVALWARLADRRLIARGVLYAACLVGCYSVVADVALIKPVVTRGDAERASNRIPQLLPSTHATTSSDQERFDSISRGLDMWAQSPLFGTGLGVFIEKNKGWFGHPVVIHSTPVWILTEFGLVGVIGFGWSFLVLLRHSSTQQGKLPARRMLGLLLLMFALFSLVHEVFYQRIFWLVLGAALASPGRNVGIGGRL